MLGENQQIIHARWNVIYCIFSVPSECYDEKDEAEVCESSVFLPTDCHLENKPFAL